MHDLDEHFSNAILAQLFGFIVNLGILPLGIDFSSTQRNLIFTTKLLPVTKIQQHQFISSLLCQVSLKKVFTLQFLVSGSNPVYWKALG